MDVVMDGNTVRVEGARPDERIISDNVLEDVQKACASSQQAASLHCTPPVCEDTIERQEAEALAARLAYQDAEVMVEVVAQADFKPNAMNFTGRLYVRMYVCMYVHKVAGVNIIITYVYCPGDRLTANRQSSVKLSTCGVLISVKCTS